VGLLRSVAGAPVRLTWNHTPDMPRFLGSVAPMQWCMPGTSQ